MKTLQSRTITHERYAKEAKHRSRGLWARLFKREGDTLSASLTRGVVKDDALCVNIIRFAGTVNDRELYRVYVARHRALNNDLLYVTKSLRELIGWPHGLAYLPEFVDERSRCRARLVYDLLFSPRWEHPAGVTDETIVGEDQWSAEQVAWTTGDPEAAANVEREALSRGVTVSPAALAVRALAVFDEHRGGDALQAFIGHNIALLDEFQAAYESA